MNKLFVRLAASGTIALSMGAPALAGTAMIGTTGPDSTNTITSNSRSDWYQAAHNWAEFSNWNSQQAHTGDVSGSHNTWLASLGGGGGSASNDNTTMNNLIVHNPGAAHATSEGGSGNHQATIHLTGPSSTNSIRLDNGSHNSSVASNHVQAQNLSQQAARTGEVELSHNTNAGGNGGSGDAVNQNDTSNNVAIHNMSAGSQGQMSTGGSNTASISLTGPDSTNQIKFNDHHSTSQATQNVVSTTNASSQSASSGDVTLSHNTVAGGASSGDAYNNSNSSNTTMLHNN